ncbi:MAG: hypothetical protein ABIH46_11020 [Chloroflexota bacterium]
MVRRFLTDIALFVIPFYLGWYLTTPGDTIEGVILRLVLLFLGYTAFWWLLLTDYKRRE